jgi:hypothetical protein
MGLLDDAIREHLDLKRRRGADPDEVARLEHEALGPVRREPAQADAAAEHTHVLAPEERHEGAHGDPLQAAVNEQPAPEPELFAHDDPARAAAEDEQPQPHGDQLLQPTTEFRVEDHHDDDDAAEPAPLAQRAEPADAEPADDVLEETPDFLQETPEHDRLWFEQRPPRDFDFDG